LCWAWLFTIFKLSRELDLDLMPCRACFISIVKSHAQHNPIIVLTAFILFEVTDQTPDSRYALKSTKYCSNAAFFELWPHWRRDTPGTNRTGFGLKYFPTQCGFGTQKLLRYLNCQRTKTRCFA
jgi:hypothetical protein